MGCGEGEIIDSQLLSRNLTRWWRCFLGGRWFHRCYCCCILLLRKPHANCANFEASFALKDTRRPGTSDEILPTFPEHFELRMAKVLVNAAKNARRVWRLSLPSCLVVRDAAKKWAANWGMDLSKLEKYVVFLYSNKITNFVCRLEFTF